MAALAPRLWEPEEHAVLRSDLPAGRRDLWIVSGLLGALAVAIGAVISPWLGALALVVAAVVVVCDAHYHTPLWIWVDATHVVLGYWMRSKRFAPRWVVLHHDVRRDRFVLSRRGRRRTLVGFNGSDAMSVTRAFIAAGVEIISR